MTPSRYYDVDNDEKAFDIGQALASDNIKNSPHREITSLKVEISEEHPLTVRGAQALADGLQQSSLQIKRLEIRCVGTMHPFEVNGNVLQPILEVAILVGRVQHLYLGFLLNDDVAERISAIYLSLMKNDNDDDDDDDVDGTNNNNDSVPLSTVSLKIGPNMTTDSAQLLASALRHVKVESFHLHAGNAISFNVLSTICIAAMESLESLSLYHKMTDETAIKIGDALLQNKTLQSLDFGLSNTLSTNAAMRLANGISSSRIVYLVMDGCDYGILHARCSVDVEEILYDGVARSPTIRDLSIGSSLYGAPGIAQCASRLHTLIMHPQMDVLLQDIPALMSGLINAPHLATLMLGPLFETAQDISTVCAALPQLTALTSLTISFHLAFEEEYIVVPTDLASRRIHATGAEQLMTAVAHCPSLCHLTLDDSVNIGFAGLAMIGLHLPNKLKTLDLYSLEDDFYEELSNEDAPECVQQAFQRACQALVIGVRSNWHLQWLTVRGDKPFELEQELRYYLALNKNGRYLLHDTDSAHVPIGLWSHVLATCDNEQLVYYYLREQPSLLLLAATGRHYRLSDGQTHHGAISLPAGHYGAISLPAGSKRRREE